MNVSSIFTRLNNSLYCAALAGSMLLPSGALAAEKAFAGSVTTYASAGALTRSGKSGSRLDTSPASSTLKRGLKALRKNNMKTALAARAKLRGGSIERKVLAWAIAINGNGVDAMTLHSITSDLAHWPGGKTMRANLEKALLEETNGKALRVAFSASEPESDKVRIALAMAHKAAGANKSARKSILPVWRNSKLSKSQQRSILKKLGPVLTRADHRARVEYLLSKRRLREAGRIAGLAGATRLVKARAAVERKQRSANSKLSAVPASQRKDANYLLSKAIKLRRADKPKQAAKVLLSAAPKSIHANAADQFWTEQRILASDLLEIGAKKSAYRLASRNVAKSKTKRIDAEFYAGWLALRKLGDAQTAIRHFERVLKLAGTPLSKSRGHYWMAQALKRAGKTKSANKHFSASARMDTTFYGQLAARKLGRKSISVSKARPTRTDRARFPKYELVQAIAKLESAGQHRRARSIYRYLARHLSKPGELTLLAARAEKLRDYQLSLQVGKTAFNRGHNVDALAWPIGAIPTNTKTSGAGLPLAYAIARQESTFQVDARSPANALGLLQLLPTTAKRTARNIGVKYSRRKLVTNASYNARLGTAYLNQQMKNFGGSFVLTFAAYNAGPGRAKDWIKRYGDPRGKSVDFVVDWIEQIPFAEKRNYVQRVMEKYKVYKTRLKGGALTIDKDLRRGRRS